MYTYIYVNIYIYIYIYLYVYQRAGCSHSQPRLVRGESVLFHREAERGARRVAAALSAWTYRGTSLTRNRPPLGPP